MLRYIEQLISIVPIDCLQDVVGLQDYSALIALLDLNCRVELLTFLRTNRNAVVLASGRSGWRLVSAYHIWENVVLSDCCLLVVDDDQLRVHLAQKDYVREFFHKVRTLTDELVK